MLNFFICFNSLKTHRPCGVKLSLPAPFLTGQRLRESEYHGMEEEGGCWFCGFGWRSMKGRVAVCGEGKGVADHGKNTIPGPSIALVPPHFTRTPTLCVPLVTDPCNPLSEPLSPSLSLSFWAADVAHALLHHLLHILLLLLLGPFLYLSTPRDGEAWWGRGGARNPLASRPRRRMDQRDEEITERISFLCGAKTQREMCVCGCTHTHMSGGRREDYCGNMRPR